MIRNYINSDTNELNRLHKNYWWIPNENMIRPCPKVLEEKRSFSDYIVNNWMSFKDFILDTHFHYSTRVEDGQIYSDKPQKSEWTFTKSLFPYNIPSTVNHYILWNSYFNYKHTFDKQVINTIISESLESIVGDDNFDFVWYINPKPSNSELWHCQVFWIRL